MQDSGRRPEPVAKLSDYLMVVASCTRCNSQMRLRFSRLAAQQRLSCERCGLSWAFDLDLDVLSAIDQSFRRLEDPIRDREAWVEVEAYP